MGFFARFFAFPLLLSLSGPFISTLMRRSPLVLAVVLTITTVTTQASSSCTTLESKPRPKTSHGRSMGMEQPEVTSGANSAAERLGETLEREAGRPALGDGRRD